ncbi:TetR/AcrR family transcriptional regulator [Cellulosimicrobium cellulans]|uniref:TetR/AcrR family transcriptional regulator n=1 Tax=Cellulosimicrobium cellulans TaxID=1710 RepID=UPI002406FE24|nr:TetR/AcrR family transcriptional regulator [Cellulosimicrobium cellulans]MDF9877693.1 AcrR family transcriptional regulator [Cellulosimicrobium cellulans]
MASRPGSPGRRERAKEERRRRIMDAARALFAEHGVGAVTTQQIADRADVAIGTLYLYASTKAELLILVQNQKFAAAIDDGIHAEGAAVRAGVGTVASVLALMEPVVACLREQPENGRTYLHELVFGDPAGPHRRYGLTLSVRLENALVGILSPGPQTVAADAGTLARVIAAIIHVTTTATVHVHDSLPEILDHVRRQVTAVLPGSTQAA